MRRILAACAALIAACSFPDVTFGPDEGGAADAPFEGAPPDAMLDDATAAAETGTPDAPALDSPADARGESDGGDGGARDGSDAADAGAANDAQDSAATADANDAADPCDMDRDLYRAIGGVCGGQDCDDNDGRRNPGVSTYQTYPTDNGDWNCDKHVDRQYPNANVSCTSILVPGSCDGLSGFSGPDPGCGYAGTYVTCAWDTLSLPNCKVSSSGVATQGCL